MGRDKKTALVVFGHDYMFYATGIYYLREISEVCSVVVAAPEGFKADALFVELMTKLDVADVVYFPSDVYRTQAGQSRRTGISTSGLLQQHRSWANLSREIARKYRPEIVVQHDYIGMENVYFFHSAYEACPHCLRITILSSQPSHENIMDIFYEYKNRAAQKMAEKYHLPKFIFYWAAIYLRKIQSLLLNILVPRILIGKSYLGLSAFRNIDIVPKKKYFDVFLAYEDVERQFYTNLFGNMATVELIQNPVVDKYGVNKLVYPGVNTEDQVIVYFSLTGVGGRVDYELISLWAEIFNAVNQALPTYRVLLKCHPQFSSTLVTEIEEALHATCPFLVFVDKSASAQMLTLQSRIVIGDASSTLLWAAYSGDKIVATLNTEQFSAYGDMQRYENLGIKSFSTADELKHHLTRATEGAVDAKISRKTLAEIISAHTV